MATLSDSLRELEKLQSSLENEIAELESALDQRRAALDKLQELKVLSGGTASRRRGRPRAGTRTTTRKTPSGRSPRGVNQDRVYQTLKNMGGPERAAIIANAVKAKFPDFGGTTFKTQVFQILQKHEKIEKVGRGLYKAK